MDENIQYSKVIEENMDKAYQIRLVVNDFRDTTYFQLRKYFLTFEGDWQASREGVSIPASLENIYAVLDGLLDICSQAEGEEVIKHYYNKLFNGNQNVISQNSSGTTNSGDSVRTCESDSSIG